MKIATIDYVIITVYFAFVLGIGFLIKKRVRTSNDFLMGGRALPLWITSLAFISANLGAQEVIGMAASGAKYGLMTSHFYWVGAIPAMVFLGLFMMPFYYGSRARSVPEYLFLRFDEKTRAFSAFSFAAMTICSSGISLYALALLFDVLLGWNFDVSILLAAGIVMAYTFLGGLTSAVYNEVLQFFLILLGISPIVILGLLQMGGWQNLASHLPEQMSHVWTYAGSANSNPMGIGWVGIVMGLGFVLSFGYWTTDFLVVQRAMIAKDMASAQKTPIVAAFPKMIMPIIVIFPGLLILALQASGKGIQLPLKPDGRVDYDMTFPTLLTFYYPNGLLGIGLTALLASFMSGMAGNVTAFNSVFTFDIYQAYLNKHARDEHYYWVGKFSTVAGIVLSILTAYLARSFNNIMDFLQLVFGFVNAPLFATFLLGMSWRRTTGHGAFWGLVAGTSAAALTHGLTWAEGKGAWIARLYDFPSGMGQAFAIAIVAWSVCFAVTIILSLMTKAKKPESLRGLVYGLTKKPTHGHLRWLQQPAVLGALVLILVLAVNFYFW